MISVETDGALYLFDEVQLIHRTWVVFDLLAFTKRTALFPREA